jgi:tetratricopeptide (TPR) repeat protein
VSKKILLLAGLAALVALQAAVAWNGRLERSGRAEGADPEESVRVLGRAEAVFPWNAAVPFELGKAHFERGVRALSDPNVRDRAFGLSVEAFLRSLRLDPGDAAAHFHLAQTLLYMSYLDLPAPLPYFEEYRRAARLTGHNSQIHFEVGKVLLGRWPSLARDERDFATDILRRTLAGGGPERLREVLETWALEVGDHGLIEAVLPEEPSALRAYARFLGERGLALERRHGALARAERLELGRARSEIGEGLRAAEDLRLDEAAALFGKALEALGGIRYYQSLAGRELLDAAEHERLRRTALRHLAMVRVDQTRSLVDETGVLDDYLDAGDEFTALGEFERFLKERGLLGEAPTTAAPFKDLATLAFRMTLDFRMNRYRDIVRAGDLLASSSVVVAPSGRPSYLRILNLIGEADLKLDYVYEAERHFRLALEAEPESLEALLGLERSLGRLNDEAGAAEVRARIEAVLGPARIDLGGKRLPKGETFAIALPADGRPASLRIEFRADPAVRAPLVAVFLNGRAAWEGNGDTGPAVVSAVLRAGLNSLEIEAVGGPLALIAVTRLSESE